ncbi:MAG: ribonuclease HI [Sphaerochaetaceae bacterium]|nr:ribonuclease HI [Sphaerochaetaceae bacterium]
MERIDIFTDGGCSGNPGPGGWAYVILNDGKLIVNSSGGNPHTTNNIMELTAVIRAIGDCMAMGVKDFSIHTDSQYVKNGITQWIYNWKKNGWRTASKDPVKNKELWTELDNLNSKCNINWVWVKGHAGIEYNEMCDSLVRAEMDKLK